MDTMCRTLLECAWFKLGGEARKQLLFLIVKGGVNSSVMDEGTVLSSIVLASFLSEVVIAGLHEGTLSLPVA